MLFTLNIYIKQSIHSSPENALWLSEKKEKSKSRHLQEIEETVDPPLANNQTEKYTGSGAVHSINNEVKILDLINVRELPWSHHIENQKSDIYNSGTPGYISYSENSKENALHKPEFSETTETPFKKE